MASNNPFSVAGFRKEEVIRTLTKTKLLCEQKYM